MSRISATLRLLFRSEFTLLVVAIGLMAALFAVRFSTLPQQIPLFYSRPDSDRQITDLFLIVLIPIIQLVFMVLNKIIARSFFEDEVFIQRLIYIVNIAIVIIGLYIYFKIMLLVS